MIDLKIVDHHKYSITERETFILNIENEVKKTPSVYLQTCIRIEIYSGEGAASSKIDLLENVKLYNIEQIEAVVEQNIKKRCGEILKAEDIINEELEKFHEWQNLNNN